MNAQNKKQSPHFPALRILIVALAALLLALPLGCDESRVVGAGNNSSSDTRDDSDKEKTPPEDPDSDAVTPPKEEEPPEESEPPEGSEPPEETEPPEGTDPPGDSDIVEEDDVAWIQPGFMNGTWRAGAGDQDAPAVYFDTFQDEGESEVTGSYTMGFAIYDALDGQSGELESGSFDGNELTITWNPTDDAEELLTLVAHRVDDDTLEGSVTAAKNPTINAQVTLTRRVTN